jgi:glyoxylase-like metal-dependent hydrolase (beta-lactamase superfamily II)
MPAYLLPDAHLSAPICVTCGAQYPPAPAPPPACPICGDERQFIGWEGQKWTTIHAMRDGGYQNVVAQEAQDLVGIHTAPRFGIGQRALLACTPAGNLLWDCLSYLDAPTIAAIRDRGGIRAIAISHPHYYASMVTWSEVFDAPVYLHVADRAWVMFPSPRISYWSGETTRPMPGFELIRLGGHFDGAAVLHWPGALDGRGRLLSGDVLQVVPDRRWVSFMYSYPNLIPLPAAEVTRIADAIRVYPFEQVYGAFEGRQILANGREAVQRSAERYVRHLGRKGGG